MVDPLEPQEVETRGRASGCCMWKGGVSAARVPSSRGTRWDCRPRVLGVDPAVLRTHGSLVVKKSRLMGGKQWCEVGSAWGFCSSGAGRGCPTGDRAPQLRTFTSAGGWGQGQWPCWAGTQAPGRTACVQLCVQEPRPGSVQNAGTSSGGRPVRGSQQRVRHGGCQLSSTQWGGLARVSVSPSAQSEVFGGGWFHRPPPEVCTEPSLELDIFCGSGHMRPPPGARTRMARAGPMQPR